jgi:hypothetical protein
MPFFVGRLPTTTQPLCNTANAVVKPTPPGHGPGSLFAASDANTLTPPDGEICTIVVGCPAGCGGY